MSTPEYPWRRDLGSVGACCLCLVLGAFVGSALHGVQGKGDAEFTSLLVTENTHLRAENLMLREQLKKK